MAAMESVTVETVTAWLVGMEINVNSSVTSAHGRAKRDARLQMARSVATEEPAYVVNVRVMMWILQVNGEMFMVIPVNVTRETVIQRMTDMQMIFAQVRVSVTVGGVTVRKAGLGRSVSIHCPAVYPWRRAKKNVREVQICLALEEESVSVASAPASHREIKEFTERTVSVMIVSVRTLMERHAVIMAFAHVGGASAKTVGSVNSASSFGVAT